MELICQFNGHGSIKKIKESYPEIIHDAFTFSAISLRDIKKNKINMHVKKLSSSKSITATILSQAAHICLPF